MLRVNILLCVILASLFFSACREETLPRGHADAELVEWILEQSKRDVALPATVSGENVTDSYYLGGFGDSDAIVQLTLDPAQLGQYRQYCQENLQLPSKRYSWPVEFSAPESATTFSFVKGDSVEYLVVFDATESGQVLISRVKS